MSSTERTESPRAVAYKAMTAELGSIPENFTTAYMRMAQAVVKFHPDAEPGTEAAMMNYLQKCGTAYLREGLRYMRSQHRIALQSTYDAAFRAGYRARKILHDSNAQQSYRKGYAAGHRSPVVAPKPLLVRTLDELKALPVHAVVKDARTRVYEQTPAKGVWYAVGWETERPVGEILLPAQVIA